MPHRTTKRKSTLSEMSVDGPSFVASESEAAAPAMSSPSRTPSAQNATKTITKGISLAQKQAILDNLQEEITVRARRLRAQYGTQAEGLRTRVEFRVNRIPPALRKEKLGDLIKKYSDESVKLSESQTTTHIRNPLQEDQSNSRTNTRSPETSRKGKRLSDEISGSTDKENADINNPKKRLRGLPAASNAKTTLPDVHMSRILSPKSSNSQMQPKAQANRNAPASKSQLARPVSPIKPAGAAGIINNMMERAKSTRAGTVKKAPPPPPTTTATGAGRGTKKAPVPKAPVTRAPTRAGKGRTSDASESSNTSNGTTGTIIVKKAAPAAKKVPAKRSVMSTIKGISATGKKAPAPKATAPTAGRVLRKRN